MKNFWLILSILMTMTATTVKSADNSPKLVMNLTDEGLVVDNINTAVLQKMFADYGYNDYVYMQDWEYPPVFLQKFPTDFNQLKDKNLRNRLFIQILTPLAMLVNEHIALERYQLLLLEERYQKNKTFSDEDKKQLETWAKKYDVFTRMKGSERYEIFLQELLLKIDGVPPSILIAAAAAESNWGTAREVGLGNSLYKWKVWYTDEGIKPLEDDDDSYRIKIYPSLLAAMEEYALKFNSDVNFQNFRTLRMHRRNHRKPLRGTTMVYNMVVGSPLENYAGLLSYIITFYDLGNLDEAELGSPKMLFKKKEN